MKRNLRLIYFGIAVCLIASVLVLGCAEPAPAPTPAPAPAPSPAPAPAPAPTPETVTLKAVSFQPPSRGAMAKFVEFTESVNAAAKGELFIDVIGGPEANPSFDQVDAVRGGVVDMAIAAGAYYIPIMPEATALSLERLNFAQLRESGYYDYMVEIHKKIGVYYLGNGNWSTGFYLWTNFKPDTPYDLSGYKFRTASLYDLFFEKFGIVGITMPIGDTYTAMERGLVDGFGLPVVATASFGLHEVTKYMVDHAFYDSNVTVLINLDTWNNLPGKLQNLLQEEMIKNEQTQEEHFIKAEEEARQKMLAAGMQVIKFSPADAKWYVDTAYDVMWKDLFERAPDTAPTLRELSGN